MTIENYYMPLTPASMLIVAERRRQIDSEGYSVEHDREHGPAALFRAACCYQFHASQNLPEFWPWKKEAWKPKGHLSNLIRAGALYLAALEVADPEKTYGFIGEIPREIRSALDSVTISLDAILAEADALLRYPPRQESALVPNPPFITGDTKITYSIEGYSTDLPIKLQTFSTYWSGYSDPESARLMARDFVNSVHHLRLVKVTHEVIEDLSIQTEQKISDA